MSTLTPSRDGAAAAAGATLPQRKALPIVAPRQAVRVLQTSRAPAQLSLFLRPGINSSR